MIRCPLCGRPVERDDVVDVEPHGGICPRCAVLIGWARR